MGQREGGVCVSKKEEGCVCKSKKEEGSIRLEGER